MHLDVKLSLFFEFYHLLSEGYVRYEGSLSPEKERERKRGVAFVENLTHAQIALKVLARHTRWGEAVPLTSLSAKVTCEAWLNIFSRTEIYLLSKREGFVEKNSAASWVTVLDLWKWYFCRSLSKGYAACVMPFDIYMTKKVRFKIEYTSYGCIGSSTRGEFTSYKPAFLQAARKLAQCTHRTRLKAAFKKALEKVDSAGDFTRHSPAFERFRL
ncbi:hypothetical protein TNCV_2920491 [Trichonephila clavipes]|nr:hypothetical protein TNCV_2920491 [Trichonephila clavipes]